MCAPVSVCVCGESERNPVHNSLPLQPTHLISKLWTILRTARTGLNMLIPSNTNPALTQPPSGMSTALPPMPSMRSPKTMHILGTETTSCLANAQRVTALHVGQWQSRLQDGLQSSSRRNSSPRRTWAKGYACEKQTNICIVCTDGPKHYACICPTSETHSFQ